MVSTTEDKTKVTEHFQEYNHLTYVREMSTFTLRRKQMISQNFSLDFHRRIFLEYKLQEAMENKMIFSVLGYYPTVRHMLVNNGWIEKIESKTRLDHQVRTNFVLMHLDSAPYVIKSETTSQFNARIYEVKFLSDELIRREIAVNLMFSPRKKYIQWDNLEPDTLVSNFPRSNFCTKIGLNLVLNSRKIFSSMDAEINYPRGFNMMNEESFKQFSQNFRDTACLSLMRYISHCTVTLTSISTIDGTVPLTTFYFAEKVCKECLKRLQVENMKDFQETHRDEIEEEMENWNEIIYDIYKITSRDYHFVYINSEKLEEITNRAIMLAKLIQEYKHLDMYDGMYNVWVLKPVANCSGYGIKLFRKLEDIQRAVEPYFKQNMARFVIQKYIERPMLIYGVKFDLRLWFVISNIHKFKIWVYHEGYVRFCSKPHYNCLLDEARHLTNVRVQRKNRSGRDPLKLPVELMWDFKKLKEHFIELGFTRIWERILKSMEKSIIIIIQCALLTNYIELRKNSFQLFGADFLIHENHEPCLIEVNNGPGLSPTTSIIAKKTTELLADMVKLIMVDRNPNPPLQSDVGKFHLIYTTELDLPTLSDATKDKMVQVIKTENVNTEEWKKLMRMKRILAGRKSAKKSESGNF